MKTSFVTNNNNDFLIRFNNNISNSHNIFFVSAFGSINGYELVKENFNKFLKKAGAAKFLFDISQGMTSPDLIEELATAPGDVKVKISLRNDKHQFIHSKLYLFEGYETKSIIVGSNNFSQGGLKSNIESSIHIDDCDDQLFSESEKFSLSLWNDKFSINPLYHEKIFNEYKKSFKNWERKGFEDISEESLSLIRNEIIELNNNENFINTNLELLHLIGALAANIRFQSKENVEKGIFVFKFRRRVANAGTEDQGFISSRIDDQEPKLRLPQKETLSIFFRQWQKTYESFLLKYDPDSKIIFQDKTKNEISYEFKLQFKNPNLLWKSMLEYVRDCEKIRGSSIKLVPNLPKNLNKINPDIGIHFIQGYSDFRSRISTGDRLNKLQRIALQVDTFGTKFLYDTRDYLESKHNFRVNINDGSNRRGGQKDSLLRLTASKDTAKLFQSSWQIQLNNHFADYNAQNT